MVDNCNRHTILSVLVYHDMMTLYCHQHFIDLLGIISCSHGDVRREERVVWPATSHAYNLQTALIATTVIFLNYFHGYHECLFNFHEVIFLLSVILMLKEERLAVKVICLRQRVRE